MVDLSFLEKVELPVAITFIIFLFATIIVIVVLAYKFICRRENHIHEERDGEILNNRILIVQLNTPLPHPPNRSREKIVSLEQRKKRLSECIIENCEQAITASFTSARKAKNKRQSRRHH